MSMKPKFSKGTATPSDTVGVATKSYKGGGQKQKTTPVVHPVKSRG